MNLTQQERDKLLNDRQVIDEINRHLWIESEKAGKDIGFDKAKDDWLANFSKAWMRYHYPNGSQNSQKQTNANRPKNGSSVKRRRAKSYFA